MPSPTNWLPCSSRSGSSTRSRGATTSPPTSSPPGAADNRMSMRTTTSTRRPLRFEPDEVRAGLSDLRGRISRRLGGAPIASLLVARIDEYLRVIDLLEARGTPAFSPIAVGAVRRRRRRAAPGRSDPGEPRPADGRRADQHRPRRVGTARGRIVHGRRGRRHPRRAAGVACAADELRVIIDDGIIADAAAGGDYIKLRADAMFSARDLRVLEVHEGWVHVATTLNGRHQPWCTFLGKGTPSTTSTQEGLAVFTEITTMSSTPDRLRKVTRRILAIKMADEGGTFLDVYRWFVDEGLSTGRRVDVLGAGVPRQHAGGRAVHQGPGVHTRVPRGLRLHAARRAARAARPTAAAVRRQAGRARDRRARPARRGGSARTAGEAAATRRRHQRARVVDGVLQPAEPDRSGPDGDPPRRGPRLKVARHLRSSSSWRTRTRQNPSVWFRNNSEGPPCLNRQYVPTGVRRVCGGAGRTCRPHTRRRRRHSCDATPARRTARRSRRRGERRVVLRQGVPVTDRLARGHHP